jgi:hypothetical protein
MMQWLLAAIHWARILLGIQLAIFVSAEVTAGMIHGQLLERTNRKNSPRAVKAASTARLARGGSLLFRNVAADAWTEISSRPTKSGKRRSMARIETIAQLSTELRTAANSALYAVRYCDSCFLP